MKRFRMLCLALLAGAAMPAAALPDDANQPIRIQANTGTLDDRQNTAVYSGNVIITQGSLRLTGNQVTLTTDKAGDISKIVAIGTPATYRQTPAVGDQPIDARALTIEYHAAADKIVLIDKAFLEQAGNTFQGQRISYDIQRQVVDAGKAAGEGGAAPERIEILIQPRKRSEPAANDET